MTATETGYGSSRACEAARRCRRVRADCGATDLRGAVFGAVLGALLWAAPTSAQTAVKGIVTDRTTEPPRVEAQRSGRLSLLRAR